MLMNDNHAGGFTLVETLVALVIMGVGMLGIAGLYVEGLRANRTAIYRTNAVMLASDMAERIRTSPLIAPQYPDGSGSTNPLVVADRNAWRVDIQERLPQGATGIVDSDLALAGAPPLLNYTITVTWPETGREDPVSYQLNFTL